MEEHSRVRKVGPLSLIAYGLMALAARGAVCAAEAAPADEPASTEQALAMLKDGVGGSQVVALLEPLAYGGDAKAQLLLGSLYVEGKSVPRNAVEGYAWANVASTALDNEIAGLAKRTMLAGESAMSGGELIRADQRATEIRSVMAERAYEQYGAGVRPFTLERPESFSPWIKFSADPIQLKSLTESQSSPDFRVGCGADPDWRCNAGSKAVTGPRCTGRIGNASTRPSTLPIAETHLVQPVLPAKLRGQTFHATTQVVVHVDRSGWICGAAIARSSGEPSWDAAAVDAVTLWRLKPATLRGEPVESLYLLGVTAQSGAGSR